MNPKLLCKKWIVDGKPIVLKPTAQNTTRQTALRRIENENEQLRVQKALLKRALQMVTVNQEWGEHSVAHIDKLKRGAVEALDELAALESKSDGL